MRFVPSLQSKISQEQLFSEHVGVCDCNSTRYVSKPCPVGRHGLVVHHDGRLGLVLVDRNTVAIGLGDVTLSFGAYPAEARGVVRFLHPLHNFALVSYDATQLNATVSI